MSSTGRITIVFESLRMAYIGVLSNKLRSSLTILGVIIGVTTVVGMLAVIQGLNGSVADMIRELGSGSFIVSKYAMGNLSEEEFMRQRRFPALTEEDARLLRNSPWIREASANVETYKDIRVGRQEAQNVQIEGLTSSYAKITGMELEYGRTFTDQESARKSNVCVIGPTIAETMFAGLDPIDRDIIIDRHRYRVIGVMKERGKMFGQDLDNYIFIPHSCFKKSFGRVSNAHLIVQAVSTDKLTEAIEDVIIMLRERRGLRTADDNNFFIITQEAILTSYNNLTGAVYAVMVGVAGISLLVGGIGIMNIMLVSVTERTREIGLRKALGAARSHLMIQFISEAAGLSSVGGLIGLSLGAGLAALVGGATPVPARIIGWSVPLAFGFAVFVGVAAGLYPALKAARMHPVDALRRE
jgi:putative ABC transport system permease protein